MHIASDANSTSESNHIEYHANIITTTAVIYTLPTPEKSSLTPNSSSANPNPTPAPKPDTSTNKAQNETFV